MDYKILLLVVGEHTLVYTTTKDDSFVVVLRGSVLKGSPYGGIFTSSICIKYEKQVRVATTEDFENFGIYEKGYKKDKQYIYECT